MAETDAHSPDVARPAVGGRAAVFALAMSAFVLNLNANVMGALLPFLRAEFAFGDGGGSLLLAAAGIGSAFGAFVVADAARRFGRRGILLGGLVAFTVVSLAHLVVRGLWPLFVVRTLAGFCSGLAYAAASAAVADVAPYERRGAVMGRFNAGLFLAIPVGLPLTAWLAALDSWRATFAVQAAVGVAAAGLSLRYVPALPPTPSSRRAPVLRNRGVLAVLLATMLHVGSFFTVVQLATSWLDGSGLVPKERQMLVWVGLGALSVLGSALLARISDRMGKRAFVLATSAVLVVCFLVLAQEPSPAVMLVVGSLLAIAAAARTGPLQALVSGLVPADQLGALMGLRGAVMQAGVFLFALGAAPIGGRLGFEGVLLLAAACQLMSYLAIRFGVEEPRSRPDPGNMSTHRPAT